VRIETYAELETPPALRRQVLDLHQQAWPGEPVPDVDVPVHDQALHPVSLLLVDGATVLAALDILRKEIVHAGARFRAGGLSTVVTHPEVRGRGHGRRLVVAARAAMPGLGRDVGIFTCDRELAGFYERAGWQLLPGTVLIGGTPDDPFPSDQPGLDKVTFGAFFSPGAQAARPSFEHARIELYPGKIDKLW
jgi:GNAT superfamily N-acetyltransferase